MTNEEIILNTLKQSREPMTAGQIAEHAGIDRKAVDKAMAQLKKHAKTAKGFLTVELNNGQMIDDVRIGVNGAAPVQFA